MSEAPTVNPIAWLVGLLGTMTLGWAGWVSRSALRQVTLEADVKYVVKSLDEIKEHMGIKPKE